MSGLAALLSDINSGAVDVTASDAAKRPAKRPAKGKEQSDLQKKLRGQAGAVNTTAQPPKQQASRSRAAAAQRATPPPAPSAAAGAAPAPSAAAAAPVQGPSPDGIPLAQRLKRVLDMLKQTRETLCYADVKAKTGLDLQDDRDLLEQLRTHSQVTYDVLRHTIQYRPKVPGITNRTDLLNYLRKHTTVEGSAGQSAMHGVKLSEVDDAYLGIAEDLKKMQEERRIYIFGSMNSGEEALFAVEHMNVPETSADVVNQFFRTELPSNVQELQDLAKSLGLRSALANRPVKKRSDDDDKKNKKKKKRKRNFNVANATNAHLPQLFVGEQPDQIDGK